MTSSTQNRRFPAPWTTLRASADCYQVQDANGVTLAWIFCRDDETRYSFGAGKLTSDEAQRLARGIARLPEFMAQRRGFFQRGGGKLCNPKRPYHVALEDNYAREHWFDIDAICKLNSLPFNATGEKIQRWKLVRLRICLADGRHPVLAPVSGALATRRRISLPRDAAGFAAAERPAKASL